MLTCIEFLEFSSAYQHHIWCDAPTSYMKYIHFFVEFMCLEFLNLLKKSFIKFNNLTSAIRIYNISFIFHIFYLYSNRNSLKFFLRLSWLNKKLILKLKFYDTQRSDFFFFVMGTWSMIKCKKKQWGWPISLLYKSV